MDPGAERPAVAAALEVGEPGEDGHEDLLEEVLGVLRGHPGQVAAHHQWPVEVGQALAARRVAVAGAPEQGP